MLLKDGGGGGGVFSERELDDLFGGSLDKGGAGDEVIEDCEELSLYPMWLTCTGLLFLREDAFFVSLCRLDDERLWGSTGQSFHPSIEDGANWYEVSGGLLLVPVSCFSIFDILPCRDVFRLLASWFSAIRSSKLSKRVQTCSGHRASKIRAQLPRESRAASASLRSRSTWGRSSLSTVRARETIEVVSSE